MRRKCKKNPRNLPPLPRVAELHEILRNSKRNLIRYFIRILCNKNLIRVSIIPFYTVVKNYVYLLKEYVKSQIKIYNPFPPLPP
jgi:hypothetical protein